MILIFFLSHAFEVFLYNNKTNFQLDGFNIFMKFSYFYFLKRFKSKMKKKEEKHIYYLNM
jgi:hypothetical protein